MEACNLNSIAQLTDDDSLFLENVFIDVRKYLQIVATSFSAVPVLIFPPVNNRLRFLIHRFVEENYKGKGFETFSVGRLHQRRIVVHPVAQHSLATSCSQNDRESPIKMDASRKPKPRRSGSNKKPDRAIYVPKFRRGITNQLATSSEDAVEKSESSRGDCSDYSRLASDKSEYKDKVPDCGSIPSCLEVVEGVSSNRDEKSKLSRLPKTRNLSESQSSDFSCKDCDDPKRDKSKSKKQRRKSRDKPRLWENDDSFEGKNYCEKTTCSRSSKTREKSECSDSSTEERHGKKSKRKKDRKNYSRNAGSGSEETNDIFNSECSNLSDEEFEEMRECEKKSKNKKRISRDESSCKSDNENISSRVARKKKSERKKRRKSRNSGRKRGNLPLIFGDADLLLEREREIRERIIQRYFRAQLANKESVADSKRNLTDSSPSFTDSQQTVDDSKESADYSQQNMVDSEENAVNSLQNMVDSEENADNSLQNMVDSEENADNSQQNMVDSEENADNSLQNVVDSEENAVNSQQNLGDSILGNIESPPRCVDDANYVFIDKTSPRTSETPLFVQHSSQDPTILECTDTCWRDETVNKSYFRDIAIVENPESLAKDKNESYFGDIAIVENTESFAKDEYKSYFRDIAIVENPESFAKDENKSYFRDIAIVESPESLAKNDNKSYFGDIAIVENPESFVKNEKKFQFSDDKGDSSREMLQRENEDNMLVDWNHKNCEIAGNAEGMSKQCEELVIYNEVSEDIAMRVASDESAVIDLLSANDVDDSRLTNCNTDGCRFDNTLQKDLPPQLDEPFSEYGVTLANSNEESEKDDCVDLTIHSDFEEGEYISEDECPRNDTIVNCDTGTPEAAKRKKLSASTGNTFYGPEPPPSATASGKTGEREKRAKECGGSKMKVDDHDWEELFGEDGDYVDPNLMEELVSALGKVSVKKASQDYRAFQTEEERTGDGDCIVEVYDFPASFTTSNLMNVFLAYRHHDGFYIKWVDDTHALAVFPTPRLADEALNRSFLSAKTRPLNQATPLSRSKAASLIPAPATRPVTCASLARRLVSSALGVRIDVAENQKSAEKRLLAEAKERKKKALQQRKEIWEGHYRSKPDEGPV